VASSCHVFHLRFCVPLSFPGCATCPHFIPSSTWTPHCLLNVTYCEIYDFLQSPVFLCLLSTCVLLAILFWNTCSFGNQCGMWRRVAWYLSGWIHQASRKLLPIHKSARLRIPDARNLYGDRCENSKFDSSGIHTARETIFSSLMQTNETLQWRWSCTSFSYEYILRTRHFGDWRFLHPLLSWAHYIKLIVIMGQNSNPDGCACVNVCKGNRVNPLSPELNPICYLLALLAHDFLHVSRISVKLLTLRLLMLYIYMTLVT
jgi:hypothetical protein